MLHSLTAKNGLLFRITHVDNLPWLLRHGLHAAIGGINDPDFVTIGNPDLIEKRTVHPVKLPPGGMLSDYVPFYFTPKSPMLYNILTGYRGMAKRASEEIAILVSSCTQMSASGVPMLYTDRHAYMKTATWIADPADLATLIDWDILKRHDFARDDAYPAKMERYQAEALAHRHVPARALLGIGCVANSVSRAIESHVNAVDLAINVVTRPHWYF